MDSPAVDQNVKHNPGNLLFEGASFPRRGGEFEFKLWSAEPPPAGFDGGDWLWQRIGSQFDYDSEGIGVLVQGQLAQAFARDCQPESLESKELVFSWDTPGGETASANFSWEEPRVNRLGLCVKSFELPNDSARPVRIALKSKP